jgi:hypothetical protein
MSASETFQNEILRPIIKSKNDFIMAFFKNYKETKKIVFENETDKRNKIENILKNDIYLKNILIGAIISSFNDIQLSEYQGNKVDISRRIVNIIAKRIFDNYTD